MEFSLDTRFIGEIHHILPMKQYEQVIQACVECGQIEGYLRPCNFCKKPICIDHLHFMTIPYRGLYGISNKTIVMCKNCMPNRFRLSAS